jgi:gamma-glutamylcyclotransferase (GGCT)/AIG2-like uncharacterized protein YtfP
MTDPQALFVYGTLRRDMRHEMAGLLSRHARFLGEGVVGGKLYDLGDYPGMTYPDDGQVRGEIYAVDGPGWRALISRLDEYEGCAPSTPEPHEYRREVVKASLANGTLVDAWAYVLNQRPDSSREIPSGDYLARRAAI